MQLVPGGQRAGRGEPHAGDAGTQAVQRRGSVVILKDIDRLDDQAHALLLSELELADRLQNAFRETASTTCTMRLTSSGKRVGASEVMVLQRGPRVRPLRRNLVRLDPRLQASAIENTRGDLKDRLLGLVHRRLDEPPLSRRNATMAACPTLLLPSTNGWFWMSEKASAAALPARPG